MKKSFTLLLIFVTLFGSITYGQSQLASAKKTDNRGIISKQKGIMQTKPGTVIFYEDFSEGVPAGWTIVDNNGAGQVWRFDNPGERVILTSTADNGFAIFDSDYYTAEDGSSDLISPTMDLSTVSAVGVSFEHFFNQYGSSTGEVFVSLDNGTTWILLVQYTEDTQNGGLEEYDLSSLIGGQSQVSFKFRYEGNDDWYWAIDDLALFIPNDHDMMVTAIGPDFVEPGGTYIPKVTVKNNGYLEATSFDINITNHVDYDQTFTVTETVAPGAEVIINCPEWIPAGEDDYLLTAEVTITGDAIEDNNTLDHGVLCLTYNYEANTIYGYKAWDEYEGPEQTVTIKPNGEYTVLSDIYGLVSFFTGSAYIDGIIYGIENGTNNVYVLDDSGLGAPVGDISGIDLGRNVVGFSYDASNEIAYVTTYYDNGVGLITSELWTLDMNTFEATNVGQITESLIISIATGNHGEIWAMDMLTDKFLSIDPTTGVGTEIGDLGFDIHFAQDMVFDPISGTLFAALCFQSDVGGMYEIKIETGAATLLGNFDPDAEMSALTITSVLDPDVENNIISFDFNDLDPDVIGTVDATNYTVNLEVPYGTDVTALISSFELSEGAAATVATVDQVSGTTANDFTDDVIYTITAAAGNTQDWTITVSSGPSNETGIISFDFNDLNPDVIGTVDATNYKVALEVPNGTDVTALIATFVLSDEAAATVATVDQISNTTRNDFTNDVTYVVTAGAGNTQDWTITVNIGAIDEANIISFDLIDLDPDVIGTIDAAEYTVALEVPAGTDITALVATFVLSDEAAATVATVDQISGTTANDFTDDVVYTVTAGAENTQDWTISVTVKPTGIDKPFTGKFELYPNPFKNSIVIEFQEAVGQYDIKVYNLVGQLMISATTDGSDYILNTGDLNSGMYMIKVTDSNEASIVQKILKK